MLRFVWMQKSQQPPHICCMLCNVFVGNYDSITSKQNGTKYNLTNWNWLNSYSHTGMARTRTRNQDMWWFKPTAHANTNSTLFHGKLFHWTASDCVRSATEMSRVVCRECKRKQQKTTASQQVIQPCRPAIILYCAPAQTPTWITIPKYSVDQKSRCLCETSALVLICTLTRSGWQFCLVVCSCISHFDNDLFLKR